MFAFAARLERDPFISVVQWTSSAERCPHFLGRFPGIAYGESFATIFFCIIQSELRPNGMETDMSGWKRMSKMSLPCLTFFGPFLVRSDVSGDFVVFVEGFVAGVSKKMAI